MIVGAGTPGGAGAVLHHRSQDLERWEYTGVLSCGRVAIDREAAMQVWECPQMIQIDGVWVLVVSVQVEGGAGHVVASTGNYDGARFIDEEWRRLAFGTPPYATSVFRDRARRPCMISWLQEDPHHEVLSGGLGRSRIVGVRTGDRQHGEAHGHTAFRHMSQQTVHAP